MTKDNPLNLPWRMAYSDTGAIVMDDNNFFLAEDIEIQQAAYIVKAVNLHSELVSALENVLPYAQFADMDDTACTEAKQLLERAKSCPK